MEMIEYPVLTGEFRLIQMETDVDHVIKLKVDMLDLSGDESCAGGIISFYEGAFSFYGEGVLPEEIVKFCNNQIPVEKLSWFYSQGHQAFLYTDTTQYRLFAEAVPHDEIYGKYVCKIAKNIRAQQDEPEVLSSMNFPRKYEKIRNAPRRYYDQTVPYFILTLSVSSMTHLWLMDSYD